MPICPAGHNFPTPAPSSVSPLSPPRLKSSLLLPGCHPVLSVLSNIPLANTQRWPLTKGACAAGARLSTTLMTPVFRAAPEESRKLHFSPIRALSTPFLMHSPNPSESYHAALPCSLNKSSPPFLLLVVPSPPTPPPVSRLSPLSNISPRAAICCLQFPRM